MHSAANEETRTIRCNEPAPVIEANLERRAFNLDAIQANNARAASLCCEFGVCRCGAQVEVNADTWVGYCDGDGFRASSTDATHVLVNCRSAVHAVPQTILAAIRGMQ